MASEIKVTNIKANDGTASLTIADSTGNMTNAGTLTSTGAITASGGIANAGTITAGTFNGTVGSTATFPAGHVIQSKYASSTSAIITGTSPAWATYQATLDITSPTAGNELFLSGCTGGYQDTNIKWSYMGIMIDDSVNNEKVIIGPTASGGIQTVAAYDHRHATGGSFPAGGGAAFGKYTIPSGSGTITCRLNLYGNGGNWYVQGSHLIVQEIQT